MEFIHSRSHGQVKRSVSITDGPVMPHPSSGTGKKIRVTSAHVTYVLRNGEWVLDSWSYVSIGGTVLRKNGEEGRETWGGSVAYDWDKDARYDWLRKLIDAMRPEGSPSLPFRLAGLEGTDDLAGA